VQIPAFLFAKIIYCNRSKLNNDLADDEIVCPSVADRLADVWIILLWPFFVVPCGLITGYVAAKLSNTPKSQIGSCLVSCAFGNSTGLVLTLLTVIHDQFEATTELGSVDATAFLSVYLLLYPVLQWGVGGWLMAGEEEEHDTDSVVKGLSQTVQLGNLSSGQPVQNTFDVTMFPRSKSERIKSNGTRHRTAKSVHIPHLSITNISRIHRQPM
jgi:predicted permease